MSRARKSGAKTKGDGCVCDVGRWVSARDDDDVCDDVRVTRMCAYAPRSAVTRHTRRRRRRRRRPSSVVIIHRAPFTRPSSLVRPMMITVVAHHHGSNALLSFVCIRIQYWPVRSTGRSCVIIFCVRIYIGGVVVPSASGRHER